MINSFNKFDNQFWKYIDELIKTSKIIIDRPKGSTHPKYNDFIYPVDYGFLEGTTSMDNSGIDIWVGTAKEKGADSILCIIDTLKRDSEIKILYSCTLDEKRIIYKEINDKYMAAVMFER